MSAQTFLGLWATAGAEASRAFDADGLPRWGRHPEHGWHHASASAVALAEEAAAHGFELPAFDCWLSALPSCPMKAELLRRRALALEWARSNDGERSRLLRHLEFMQERWRADLREQALLPLARKTHKQALTNRSNAARQRTPEVLAIAIANAKRQPGGAKDQWQHLLLALKADGYVVREFAKNGGPAFEVQLPKSLKTLSFKTFSNRKS